MGVGGSQMVTGMTASTTASTTVHINVAAGELTIGNLEAHMARIVAYARSKGAPDTAVLRLSVSPLHNQSGWVQTPIPHDAAVMWLEDAVVSAR